MRGNNRGGASLGHFQCDFLDVDRLADRFKFQVIFQPSPINVKDIGFRCQMTEVRGQMSDERGEHSDLSICHLSSVFCLLEIKCYSQNSKK